MDLMIAGGEDGVEIIGNYFVDMNTFQVKTNGVVVECGAAEGFFNPSLTLETHYNWKYFAFEPDPIMFQTLCHQRPNSTKISAALSNFVGESEFYMTAHNGNSSLKHNNFHTKELETYKERFENGSTIKKIDVQVIDWKEFITTYNVKTVDLITLDVEGHELSVLDGIIKTNVLPSVIQVEFLRSDPSKKHLNEEKKQDFSGFLAVAEILNKHGYLFDYVCAHNAHFSHESFWVEKERPVEWVGEILHHVWLGYCFYEADICKPLVRTI